MKTEISRAPVANILETRDQIRPPKFVADSLKKTHLIDETQYEQAYNNNVMY